MEKTALITGINGQDGSYLAQLLLREGYTVHGTIRRASTPNLQRIEPFRNQLSLHYADLSDPLSITRAVDVAQPDEVYNLGAMSDVGVSFAIPDYAGSVSGLGATRVLEAVRQLCPGARFYQAGSSEMFGMNPDVPTNEESRFHPGSPYAAAKVYAYHMTVNYREAYGIHATNGILFNHESERRGVEFVTRKISLAVAAIASGRAKSLSLGSLDMKRDWGHARDYVEAIHLAVQADEPDDYVIATGETHSVREFVASAFDVVGLDWQKYVRPGHPDYLRPTDPPVLLGDASKARRQLGWEPKVSFHELVTMMVEYDLEEAQKR